MLNSSRLARASFTLVCFLFFAFATSCSTSPSTSRESELAADGPKTTVVGTFAAERKTLPNGLRIIVVEDHNSPTFAYETWYRVGSRDETPGKTGLAHLFEHMMFKETTHLKDGEFSKTLDSVGAEGENAFTNHDYTAYVQELPKEQLDLIIRLESDRMTNLVVNDAAFRTELEVVQNERRMRNENNPEGLMYQELYATAYRSHSYRWPVIGYAEDLAAMSAKDAVDFYRAHYRPAQATIVVVGDVEAAKVFGKIERAYGSLGAPESPPPAPASAPSPEPPQTEVRRKSLPLHIQVEKVMLAYPIPQFDHEDTPALRMLEALLCVGKSSRLTRALVDSGIATSVECGAIDAKDPSLFFVGVSMQKGKSASQAEWMVQRELAQLTKKKVPEPELERARNSMSFQFYNGLDSGKEMAGFIGRFESISQEGFLGGVQLLPKALKVGADELLAVSARYFQPASRTIITGVPK